VTVPGLPPHPLQRLLRIEELVRRRRPDDHRRHVASQRAARIDANPHQIDAVVFALARIPDGGCILADEVGLGKTIEAGLVIAQLLAEGTRRILIVTPKALLGQWQQELATLFGITTRPLTRAGLDLAGDGVFLATRDLVGSDAGAAALLAAERLELCIIDEAHEVFANIHRRFDRDGAVRDDASHARLAGRLDAVLRGQGTPVILLTATPIQNSLLELWGLVHYVDPTGALLGDLPTFRGLFCAADERVLTPGTAHDLQRRLEPVLKRTLRRQAQPFLRDPFVARQARLFEYAMSPDERALYDDVTSYLLDPTIYAFRGNHRQLLLIGFHRRMASSLPALSSSLTRVADRLRALTSGEAPPADDAELEELDDDRVDAPAPPLTESDRRLVADELARVETFIARAGALPTDSKAAALRRAVALVFEQAAAGKSSGKILIFTESLTTQAYLRELLLASYLVGDDEVTLFRGTNDGARAQAALAAWQARHPQAAIADREIAMRLALVEEFRHTSKVLISTEAGAKGLNLQFCDTVINYDLPWNPQRIEQRIGRCHRYGQRRDVTVINFLARDNEAQQLTFELLSQKLDLFGTVLGASDEILHRPGANAAEALISGVGADFEAQLRRIYERARTLDEISRELRVLRDEMTQRRLEFEAAQQRAEALIQDHLDDRVQQAFREIQAALPPELAAFDRDVEEVALDYLDRRGASYQIVRGDPAILTVAPDPTLPAPLAAGLACVLGAAPAASALSSLHLGHPLIVAAVAAARAEVRGQLRLRLPAVDTAHRGRRGRLRVVRITQRGFDTSERLRCVALLEGLAAPLGDAEVRALLAGPVAEAPPGPPLAISDGELDDAVDEILFHDLGEASARDQPRFEAAIAQLERALDDRLLLLGRQRDAVATQLATDQARRDAAIGSDVRAAAERAMIAGQRVLDDLDRQLARLRAGDDDAHQRWRRQSHGRRYARPDVHPLLDAELELT
jgi:adenine-specific DNA-methyltransferase